jgi:hypothetical protein
MFTFVSVDNNKDLDLEIDNNDRDCTKPVKSEANDKGFCLFDNTEVLGSGL